MFCTNCGEQHPDGQRFCTGCGQPLPHAADTPAASAHSTPTLPVHPDDGQEPALTRIRRVDPAPTSVQPTTAQDEAPGPHEPKNSRGLLIALLVAAVLVGVAVLGGMALTRSSQDGPSTQATAPPAKPTISSPTQKSAENLPPSGSGIAGSWTGEMAGGKYYFELVVSENDNGRVNGSMYQRSASTGASGTQTVVGHSNGRDVSLHGTKWSPDAPSTWALDRIRLTVEPNNKRFTGTYTCPTCDGYQSLTGRRQ